MKTFLLLLLGILLFNVDNEHSGDQKVHIVKMERMRFVPETIEIEVGETVRWINDSDLAHNVKAKEKRFKSKILSKRGESFEYNFKESGTFDYYCQPHRFMGMKGRIIVKK